MRTALNMMIHNIHTYAHTKHKRQTLRRYLCSLELQIKVSECLSQAHIPHRKAEGGSLVNEPSLLSKLTVDDEQTW